LLDDWDDGVPYAGLTQSVVVGKDIQTFANTSLTSNDSPTGPLFNDESSRHVAYGFKTYLMYQPSGGIWVPLSEFDWNIGADFVQSTNAGGALNGVWQSQNVSEPNSDLTGKPPAGEPTWQGYFTGFLHGN